MRKQSAFALKANSIRIAANVRRTVNITSITRRENK